MYEEIRKKIFRNYKIQSYSFCVIWLTLFFYLMVKFDNLIAECIIFLFFYIQINPIIRKIMDKNFLPPLFNELDSQKFHYIVFSNKKIAMPILYQINAAKCYGDYQTAVNICVKKLTDKLPIKIKCIYLSFVAASYFELQDLEKLKIVCEKLDTYIEGEKNSDSMKKQYPVIQFYHSFLKKDFESCVAYCKEQELNPGSNVNIQNNLFKYAVTYYKAGNLEKAKQYFEELIEFAPKMNVANLAKKYLTVIETGNEKELEFPEILPDDTFEIYSKEIISKSRTHRIVSYILICILVIALILPKILLS